MSSINNYDSDPSDVDGNTDPSLDPYSKAAIMIEINNLIIDMKKNPFADPTAGIAKIMGDMNGFQGNVVSADALSQTAMSNYIAQMTGMQSVTSDGSGKPVPDINPYTGEKVVPTTNVAPETALAHQIDYIENNMYSPFKLDSNGKPIEQKDSNGNPVYVRDANGNIVKNHDGGPQIQYEKNPIFAFYTANPSLAASLKSNLDTFASAINNGGNPPSSQDQKGSPGYFEMEPSPPAAPGTPRYNDDGTPMMNTDSVKTTLPTGKFVKGNPTASPPTQDHYEGGAIWNIWAKAGGDKPDETLLQAMQSAAGTTSSTLTSGSSAVQAIAKVDTQNYQTVTGVLNSMLMDIINLNKGMQKGQTTQ